MNLRLITLENPYLCFADRQVRDLFGGLCGLRLRGYGPDYPKSYIPFEKYDLVATHHLFCLERSGEFYPIAGFRQVSLSTCDAYSLKVPLLAMLSEDQGSLEHSRAVGSLVDTHRNAGRNLIDGSGLTIDKEYRKDRELAEWILGVVAALAVWDMEFYGAATYITANAIRFKVDQRFAQWGYKPIERLEGGELPAFVRTSGGYEELGRAMALTEPSLFAKECLEKHRQYIANRLYFAPTVNPNSERERSAA